MIAWSYSQWWVLCTSACGLVTGVTIAANISWGIWPPNLALGGFAVTCAAWSGIAILVYETRRERQETRLHRVGGGT